ncbi:hypothetical protein ACHAW6_007606 [Cyclotella cf. meneghiniana]
MSSHPNNVNNRLFSSYDNLGTYSSLGDRANPARLAGQQSSPSSIYSSFGAGQTWSVNPAENPSYSAASNPGNNNYRGDQQAVTWVFEQPNPQHNTNVNCRTNIARGDQQPVTWIVEQPSHQYRHQSDTQLPQPQQQVSNIYARNQNVISHQMQYEPIHQRSNPFSSISFVPNSTFQPSTGVFSSPKNSGLFSAPYIPITLPHLPPPPPALLSVPFVSSRSRSPTVQSAPPQLPPGQKREYHPEHQKRPRDDDEHGEPGQRNHESKSKRRRDKKQLRWQPPTGKQNGDKGSKKLVPKAQAKKEKPQKKGNNSHNDRVSVQTAQSIDRIRSHPGGEVSIYDPSVRMNKIVEANVAAINALSALETKWTAPVSKPLTRTQRRRRNRNKKNSPVDNLGSVSSGSNSLRDAVDLIGNWVNVESSGNKTTTAEAPKKALHQSLQSTGQLKQCAGPVSVNNFIDLTDDMDDFPPLSGNHQNDTEHSHAVESEGNNGGISLNEMSTSQLESYAAALSRAIDDRTSPVAPGETPESRPSFQQLESDLTGKDRVLLNDEMDISEDGHESEGTAKPANMRMNHNAPANIPVTSSDVSNAESNEIVEFNATDGSLFEAADVAVALDKSSICEEEKQKYRLRLEELRAKAKLANAKLRLAKKKRALGHDAPLSSQPTFLSEDVSKIKDRESSATQSKDDVTALRLIKRLVIDVNGRTEPEDKLRFVESVYQDTTDDDQTDETTERATSPPVQEPRIPSMDSESTRKESESLKQKLQLAKLRLEIKKKERELEAKMKQSLAKVALKTQGNVCESIIHALPSAEPLHYSQQPLTDSAISTNTVCNQLTKNSELANCEGRDKAFVVDINEKTSALEKQKIAQIVELKRRQKDLKQSNEVSNLRNLIQRQREILRAKGQELTESSTQLKSCVNEIKSKQQDLAASEERLEEMNHRKRIMQGMVLRATEKLMTARTNLRERQVQEANSTSRSL